MKWRSRLISPGIALNFMFMQAIRSGLPMDTAIVNENAKRINAECPICLHPLHLIEQLEHFLKIRDTDCVHVSGAARTDGSGRRHNNPPDSLKRINDDAEIAATA